jgi:YHS domain-containing protein
MRMEKNVLNQADVLDQIANSVVAAKINVDEHPELGRRFNIESLPTDVFLEPNGKHLIESTGQRTVEEYKQAIARASTRYTDLLAKQRPSTDPAAAQVADSQEQPAQADAPPMLSGYCPVTLWTNRKWEKGSPQFQAEHQGQTYWLTSQEQLDAFQQHPERYVPQFLGCDPILIHDDDRTVAGSTRYGAFYDDELFLFTSDENRKRFKADPDKYIQVKVVFDADQVESVVR